MDQQAQTQAPPEQSAESKRPKIADMTLDERRRYNRDLKKKSRSRLKKEKGDTEILSCWEGIDRFWASPQYREVRDYAKQQHQKISEELDIDQWSNHPAYYSVDTVLLVSYGYEHDFTRRVIEPVGILVSGYFPDAISSVVADTHQYDLERSTTYSNLYRELLKLLDKKFRKNGDKHSQAITEERNNPRISG